MLSKAWDLLVVMAGARAVSQLHYPVSVRWVARIPRIALYLVFLACIVAVTDLRWTLLPLGALVQSCIYALEDFAISHLKLPEDDDEPRI